MRFFQHFLLKCYPAQPVANESVWTHEVPVLAHEVCPSPRGLAG